VSGGKSPFYGGNRFKTISQILSGTYDLNTPELKCISYEAKSFIQKLLQPNQSDRMSPAQCLQHKWLASEVEPGVAVQTLEVILTKKFKKV
jgi:serine/threonine protein kinase